MIIDVASGLNEDRKGLLKFFDIVEKRQVDVAEAIKGGADVIMLDNTGIETAKEANGG